MKAVIICSLQLCVAKLNSFFSKFLQAILIEQGPRGELRKDKGLGSSAKEKLKLKYYSLLKQVLSSKFLTTKYQRVEGSV